MTIKHLPTQLSQTLRAKGIMLQISFIALFRIPSFYAYFLFFVACYAPILVLYSIIVTGFAKAQHNPARTEIHFQGRM